jgi:BirA family biotin operon repressor/biotin-[acetyl-CoA-carboxylase] ligase
LLLAAELAHEFDLWVKWPNDLMTSDGHKVGGILSSVHTLGIIEHTVVVGVGINVYQTNFPPEIKASSLHLLTVDDVDSRGLLSRTDVVDRMIQVFDRVNVNDTLDRWRERSITLDKTVTVAGRRGVVSGIREDGALIVDGIPITSGDVTLLEM